MREKDVRCQVSAARSAAKDLGRDFDRGEANAADGNAVAFFQFLVQMGSGDREAAIAVLVGDAGDAPDFFDDASKHVELS